MRPARLLIGIAAAILRDVSASTPLPRLTSSSMTLILVEGRAARHETRSWAPPE